MTVQLICNLHHGCTANTYKPIQVNKKVNALKIHDKALFRAYCSHQVCVLLLTKRQNPQKLERAGSINNLRYFLYRNANGTTKLNDIRTQNILAI